jgi:hypothetical protein
VTRPRFAISTLMAMILLAGIFFWHARTAGPVVAVLRMAVVCALAAIVLKVSRKRPPDEE